MQSPLASFSPPLSLAGTLFLVTALMMPMKMMKNKALGQERQEALSNHGAQLRIDGLCGIKTIKALRRFQKTQGLKVTGMPDPATLKALGLGH